MVDRVNVQGEKGGLTRRNQNFTINTETATYPDTYFEFVGMLQEELARGLLSKIIIQKTS